LLAGTGLRIGEALALKPTDLSPDCRVLYVRRSIWRGKEQEPKTPNAVREVDIPELLARLLQKYAANKSGICSPHPAGDADTTQRPTGFARDRKENRPPCFRRFRTETLRRARVPKT